MTFTAENGRPAGRIGQGTWYLGENRRTFARECEALRCGIEAGMTLIDTAEMYGEGAAETLVGRAVSGAEREGLFLVSKVYPFHAGRSHIFRACEDSLRRMGTEYLDLYLLHWRGSVPLAQTVECMEELKARGLIRAWGVSNFDRADMEELFSVPGGDRCAANQVLYHLGSRGVEYDLLPWMQKHSVAMMAYCPLAQAGALRRGLMDSPAVQTAAQAHGVSAAQVLLAFTLRQPGVVPIPRTGDPAHTLDNAGAAGLILTDAEFAALDAAFPAPDRPVPLDIV